MQCPRCGQTNEEREAFCVACGAPLTDAGFADSPAQGDGAPGAADPSDENWPSLEPVGEAEALPGWLARPSQSDAQSAAQPAPDGQYPSLFDPPPPSGPAVSTAPGLGETAPFSLPDSPNYPSYYAQSGVHPPVPFRSADAQPSPAGADQPPAWIPPATPPTPPTALAPRSPAFPADTSGVFRAGPLALRNQSIASRPLPPAVVQVDVLTPGTVLKGGRYRIIQRFGPAYSATPTDREPPLMMASDTDLPSGRVLVQEILLASVRPEDTEQVRQQIVQRLLALGRVPGIVRLLDSFSERRRHFLVFELPSGDRLLDRMQRAHGPLPETDAIGYALQVLDVLQMLERERPPFVHGNITPANIILRPSGQVVLVGISPALLVGAHTRGPQMPSGAGNPYAAPEQVRGQADSRSDLYALCAVMHHAVTGAEPANGRAGIFEPARHLTPSVSLELEEVLGAGLRPSPSQRFQSAAVLRSILEPLASGRRLTHVPNELREDPLAASDAAPVRDARGRLVLPRQRATQNPLFIVTMVLLLVILVGGGVFYTLLPRMRSGPQASGQPTVDTSSALFQEKGIGLSGGQFVFDIQRGDNDLKQRGARAVAAQDLSGALLAYQDALRADPADAEAAIYAEDLRILLHHEPYVTMVAAVAFGSDDDNDDSDSEDNDSARSELQGIFLAQQRINTFGLMANNLQMRVLILNSGRSRGDTDLAANLVLDQMRAGNPQHLIAVVGWPESAQTQLAAAILNPTGLAIVSPTASYDAPGGHSANVFQLVPTDSQQGRILADAALTQLHATRILVVADPKDAQSAALADSFAARVQAAQAGALVVGRVGFTMGTKTNFTDVANTAVSKSSDLVFIAGNHRDAILLAQSIERVAGSFAAPPHVLLPPQADMPAFLGLGNDPGAQAAHEDPSALSLLYLATYADLSEWQQLGLASLGTTSFLEHYGVQFGSGAAPGGLNDPDAVTILSEDAFSLLTAAASEAVSQKGASQYPDPTGIRVRLLQVNSGKPFPGFGGAIAFTQTGHQQNKALGILRIAPLSAAQPSDPVGTFEVVAVTGDKAVFCGKSSCDPEW
jgi:ABC-type branched-subunit amino acid transport system substrate-binding protein/serine/threonine protein kinase